MERAMKRLLLAGIVAITAATSGCIGGYHGPYAFFRDPAEQLEINRQYDQYVISKQQGASTAVGATTGSGEGSVGATTGSGEGSVGAEYWRY